MSDSLFQRLQKKPLADTPEPLPDFFHVALQQLSLRTTPEPTRILSKSENQNHTEHTLLTYIMGRAGDPTPRLLSAPLLDYLNAVDEPESELPATRFVKLLCERMSPYDRIADLRTKESRRRFYLDFLVIHNFKFKLPDELFPDFIWKALAEQHPDYPLSWALAHFWRKTLAQLSFQPNNDEMRTRFLNLFIGLAEMHGLDPRIIPPEMKNSFAVQLKKKTPPGFVVSAIPASPIATEPKVNLWQWDDTSTVAPYLNQRLEIALKVAGISHLPLHPAQKEKQAPGAINLFACAPDYLAEFMLRGGLEFFEGRKNIGFCSWETDRLPSAYKAGLHLLDEIWVPSAQQQNVFQAFTDKPVNVLALPVNSAAPALLTRASLGIAKDTFLFLQVFDAADSLSRKNIVGAIDAFQHAFKNENVALLIKVRGNNRNLASREEGIWARVKRKVDSDPRIILLHEEITDAEQAALISESDAVISLHRASSFGATLLEAAMLGKPVITSNVGGVLEYLPEAARITVPVVEASAVFDVSPALDRETGHRWHDPDVAEAAKAMRELYEKGAEQSRQKISQPFNPAQLKKHLGVA
jgi:glycosyltransferase involved in cell wall biosynthesis